MSTRSKEYQALALLGPGTTEREWQIRLLLAHAIADKVVSKYAGEEIPTEGGAALPAYVRRRQAEMKEELPPNCGIEVVLTIDVGSGLMAIEVCTRGCSAYEQAKATGADYVRCRACANTGAPLMRNKSWIALDDTCQPLNGPDDMLCPCGKLREPYDCQADEWIKA